MKALQEMRELALSLGYIEWAKAVSELICSLSIENPPSSIENTIKSERVGV